MIHRLKIKPEYLARIKMGEKKSEVRFNDRDFQCSDVVELYELNNGLTSLVCTFKYQITHVHSGLGMADNYVVLSFIGI